MPARKFSILMRATSTTTASNGVTVYALERVKPAPPLEDGYQLFGVVTDNDVVAIVVDTSAKQASRRDVDQDTASSNQSSSSTLPAEPALASALIP